jgi:transposase-like protein
MGMLKTLNHKYMIKKLNKFAIVNNNMKAANILRKIRWKDHIYCPNCGCVNDILKHSKSKSGILRYLCTNCHKTFSDTSGSVFSKSKIPLWKWIYVIITLFESTGSLSAAEAGRNIQVSYKAAFNMMKKIRKSFENDWMSDTLKGIVEADEAWVSHKKNQQILLGIVERQGKVKLFPIKDRTELSIAFPHIKFVEKGSLLCTDSLPSYNGLNMRFTHFSVNHSKGQFKWRDIYTNTIEGVWSMLKGILRTIHHGVSKFYLLDYCNLFSFMYSNRHLAFIDKFNIFFKKLCQPRCCTY